MKTSTFIRPAAGLGVLGAVVMASAIGLAFLGATARVSVAAPADIRVRYGDLDLSSAAGVETLRRRVLGAAKQVCEEYDSADLQRAAVYQRCVKEAVDHALT